MSLPQELCGSTYEDFAVYMSEADKESLLDEEVKAIEDMDDDSIDDLHDWDFFNQQAEDSYLGRIERSY